MSRCISALRPDSYRYAITDTLINPTLQVSSEAVNDLRNRLRR